MGGDRGERVGDRYAVARCLRHSTLILILILTLTLNYPPQSSPTPPKALFVHADVRGASLNSLYTSTSSLLPSHFPANLPVFSGHFHLPHTVREGGRAVTYIGSPYQQSFSEAGDQKRFLELDADFRWARDVPVGRVGREYFIGSAAAAEPGDMVRFDVMEGDEELLEVEEARSRGVDVIVRRKARRSAMNNGTRLVRSANATQHNDDDDDDGALFPPSAAPSDVDLAKVRSGKERNMRATTPSKKISFFVQHQPFAARRLPTKHRTNPNAMKYPHLCDSLRSSQSYLATLNYTSASPVYAKTMSLLEDSNSTAPAERIRFSLTNVTLSGFASFESEVTYPLLSRGLVMLRGSGNGAGKSSLIFSILWCLTGALDARPVNDAVVNDVIHSKSKVRGVSLIANLPRTQEKQPQLTPSARRKPR